MRWDQARLLSKRCWRSRIVLGAYLFRGQFRYPAPEVPARRQAMGSDVTAEQRQRMIAEAAYFRAQRRGFENGNSTQDWLAAEAEIDRAVAQRNTGRVSITPRELEQLMQRAREAQLELIAEALKAKLQEQAAADNTRPRSNGADSLIAWEALSAALHSIATDQK